MLRRWGAGLFWLPHMISVGRDGSVWVTDVGRHQALKFTPQGELLATIGTEGEPGAGKDRLCKPTQARARAACSAWRRARAVRL